MRFFCCPDVVLYCKFKENLSGKQDFLVPAAFSCRRLAEKLIAAQKGKDKIAIEVKTFEGASLITDYHRALGQYMDYLVGLRVQEPSRKLYLAVSEMAYEGLMKNPLSKLSLELYKINVLIVDVTSNNIIKWIE